MTRRRDILTTSAFGLVAAAVGGSFLDLIKPAKATPKGTFPFNLTKEEWHKRLEPAAFDVLREEGTERAFTSPLNDEHRNGTFACKGCAQKLFASDTKFDSGTGWPSFFQPLSGAVGESADHTYGVTRTEVHCANCGGHLGHVFDDGPKPTGLRYCMNGVAMTFAPA